MVHCAFCASKMIWQSDFNYDEIYDDGDGIGGMRTPAGGVPASGSQTSC